MSPQIICIPVADDGQVGHSWGKARTLAVATVQDGTITSWHTQTVDWDVSKSQGTEGAHHEIAAQVGTERRDHAGRLVSQRPTL